VTGEAAQCARTPASGLMRRVIAIAQGNGANLTRLNTAMRMISMISRIFPSVSHQRHVRFW